MKYDKEKHHRRSIRLKYYDYSRRGAYFVTICTKDRECLLGQINEETMMLNNAGEIVKKWWCELENKFKNIELDEYVIMPNHFHGIINIVGADLRVCPKKNENKKEGEHIGSPLQKILQWFKIMTTNEYIRNIKEQGWLSLNGKLWQRNYYEHIIRNEKELNSIREYIRYNPLKWDEDEENPNRR